MEFSSLSKILETGIQEDDSEETRLQKSLLIAITIGTGIPGVIWGWVYYFYGEPFVAIIPSGYSVMGLFIFLLYRKFPENYANYYMVIRLMILFFPFLIMIALGGFIQISVVIVWSMMGPPHITANRWWEACKKMVPCLPWTNFNWSSFFIRC